jgi:hypothetical protein
MHTPTYLDDLHDLISSLFVLTHGTQTFTTHDVRRSHHIPDPSPLNQETRLLRSVLPPLLDPQRSRLSMLPGTLLGQSKTSKKVDKIIGRIHPIALAQKSSLACYRCDQASVSISVQHMYDSTRKNRKNKKRTGGELVARSLENQRSLVHD